MIFSDMTILQSDGTLAVSALLIWLFDRLLTSAVLFLLPVLIVKAVLTLIQSAFAFPYPEVPLFNKLAITIGFGFALLILLNAERLGMMDVEVIFSEGAYWDLSLTEFFAGPVNPFNIPSTIFLMQSHPFGTAAQAIIVICLLTSAIAIWKIAPPGKLFGVFAGFFAVGITSCYLVIYTTALLAWSTSKLNFLIFLFAIIFLRPLIRLKSRQR